MNVFTCKVGKESNITGLMRSFIKTIFFTIFVLTTIVGNAQAQSFMPSPQQIAQFKNLPRAQQEALARQMGFDISVLDGLNNQSPQTQQGQANTDLTKVDRVVDEKTISEQLSRQTIASEVTKDLKPFGYDLFNSADSNFAPLQNMPIPQDYVLGIGDELVLRLFGKESGNFTLRVSNEGVIDIPDLGPMMVAGLSYQETKKAISEKYNQQKIGVEPFVSMGQIRTIQVYMVGEVFQPGSLNVSSLSTVSTALFASGGVSEIGSLRNIEVKRAGKTVAQFDLYDLLVDGDVVDDIRLQQGDVIFVPVVNRVVSIDGQVRRPAIYELKDGESLSKLVSLAGGLLPSADESALQLVRKSAEEGLVIKTINYVSDRQKDEALEAGDFVNVLEASLEFSTAIRVQGAINSPQLLSVEQKQTLSDLVTPKSMLKRTDLEYALVLRKPKFSDESQVIQFKPRDVIFGDYDLPLESFDQVFFFDKFSSKADEDEKKVVESDLLSSGNQTSLNSDSKLLGKASAQQFTRKDLIQKEEANSSRKALLAPVIASLRNESNEESPVKLIKVTGQVKFPGTYPLASNNPSISAVIRAAGGLTEAAHLANVEISSFDVQSGSADIRHKNVNLLNELAKQENKQQTLASKDVLNIPRIPDWFDNQVIELRGEFVFPGTYQIRRGETLASVIQRAGGLTNKASIDAAVFTREELKVKEQENIDKAIEDLRQQLANNNLSNSQFSKTIDYDSATKVLDDLTSVTPVGRLVIDLEGIVKGERQRNIELKSGDVLYVPNITPAISVIGEVFVPTTHWYADDMTVEDYVKLSGGTREYADNSKIYIVRADGSVVTPDSRSYWFSSNNKTALQPGDTIVVPRDVTNYDNISVWQGVTQIVYQTAVALAAIGSL